jgi:hypothetical protein
MGCVLRVAGRDFDVDAYVSRGALLPAAVYRRGENRSPTLQRARRGLQSGFSVVVSRRDFSDFAGQVKDAIGFLGRHRRAVRALRRRKGVESAVLDFGVDRRPQAEIQVQVFSEELVRLAGDLGLALELSFYPAAEGLPG